MATFIGLLALVLLIVAFVRGPVTGEYDPAFSGIFGGAAGLLVLGCGCWLLCRLIRLRRLLAEGARVTGSVLRVDSVIDGGWYMLFAYHLDGRPYQAVIGSPSKPRYEVGELVALVVDPRTPSRAIVEEKYSKGPAACC
jgi:Protein of unknown function (DUF3592)